MDPAGLFLFMARSREHLPSFIGVAEYCFRCKNRVGVGQIVNPILYCPVMHIVQNPPAHARRPVVPASFLPKLMLPFAIPIVVTFILILTVGNNWPRDIAPGSGLKLPGLIASAVTAFCIWRLAVRNVADRRARTFAAILCSATGLIGWPVWSVGVLPSINGASLGPPSTASMRLERVEITQPSKRRGYYYWAWLQPDNSAAPVGRGRYFIPENIYEQWEREKPASVEVSYAQGILGAQVVTKFR